MFSLPLLTMHCKLLMHFFEMKEFCYPLSLSSTIFTVLPLTTGVAIGMTISTKLRHTARNIPQTFRHVSLPPDDRNDSDANYNPPPHGNVQEGRVAWEKTMTN